MLVLFFLSQLTKNQKNHLIGALSVINVLTKTFLIFVVRFFIRNNSCGNSSSSKFFLFSLHFAPVLFFAADFNLLNCVFVNLTLASWEFNIFYKTVTLPRENLNFVSLFLSKIVKIDIDWDKYYLDL